MDESMNSVFKKRAKRVIGALKSNNINGYFAEDCDEALEIIASIVRPKSTVASGGSVTLFEAGVIDMLRDGDYKFLDRYAENLSKEQIKEIYLGAFSAHAYFTGLNAITEDGTIYNVDGNGNRVAAIIYGPEKVIFVAGRNKIVKDLDEAIERNKTFAAPPNTARLKRKTPCAELGYCVDCNSEERICNKYSLVKKESDGERMHVIIINENLGY